MPAFCAAFGSFHPKSSVMYFVRVFVTVRVLPLFLTFTLIRSSTLTVSTFGVRSYSDQRYWSMQTSGMGQASSASELSAGPATVCTGSVGLIAATSTGGVGIGGETDEAALPLAISAAEIPYPPSALARGASMCSGAAVASGARVISGAPVGSIPSQPRPASPHTAAKAATRLGLFTPGPSQLSQRSNVA